MGGELARSSALRGDGGVSGGVSGDALGRDQTRKLKEDTIQSKTKHVRLFVVKFLQLVIFDLKLVPLLLHMQGVVARHPRETNEAQGRCSVDCRTLAPHKAAGLERGVFRKELLVLCVGRRAIFARDRDGIFELQLPHRGRDERPEVKRHEVRVDIR